MANKEIPSGASIAVIGAGIIGVASAYQLACQGYHVAIYDPAAPGEAGPSRANAGHLGASEIYPLSTPGIHWTALKMLMHRDGALKIPVRDALVHIPWFWRFWRTSQGQRFETATRALSYLCRHTLTDTSAMLESAGINDMLVHRGAAFLYDTEESFISSKQVWAGKAAHGFDSEEMDAERIARDIPGITDKFRYAVLSRKWAMVRSPLGMVRGLAKAAESEGVIFHRTCVHNLSAGLNAVTIETDKCKNHYDAAVVAAGVNSVVFAKSCGDFFPMVAERGYNLTGGLRIGGWAEYARPNRPANQNYFKSIARISVELFPGLNLDDVDFWMGNRPSLPDSVPVISRASRVHRIFYNCGHGHYGLTHAASSARILTELVSDPSADEKYKSYAITRFENTY